MRIISLSLYLVDYGSRCKVLEGCGVWVAYSEMGCEAAC